MKCSEGCDRPAKVKGMCLMHRSRVCRRENPDRVKANNKRWSDANRARHRSLSKKWRKLNPVGAKSHVLTRKARLVGPGGSFTPEQWLAKLAKYGKRCPCCGKVRKLTIDHIVPLSKGGKNVISNLQPLCGPCNDSKGVRIVTYEPLL